MAGLRIVLHSLLALLLLSWSAGCNQPEELDSSTQKSDERRAEYKSEAKMDDARADAPGAAAAKETATGTDGKEGEDGEATTWKRSKNLANTSRLMIGDEESLPLEGMHVRTTVDGFRARVLIDFFFFNPEDRQYEGTFSLRLRCV